MTTAKTAILVVDDEKGMRDLLSFMLRTEGYHIGEAANGQEALAQMKTETFDVVIADIMMPGMTGLELLGCIREQDNDAVVIVITAYASLQTAIEAMKFGAYDYLIKPFDDVDKVMNIVARAADRRRLMRRNARLLGSLQETNDRLQEMLVEAQERTTQLEAAYAELKELEHLKSQFVSNVSHELRTPLALMKGYLTLMADHFLGNLNDTQDGALKVVNERTDGLIQMVEDLLFMQDIELDHACLSLEAVSLAIIVQRVCRRLQPRARRKAVILYSSIEENENKEIPIIQGDALRLEQAITHLLDNAIKFSQPGGHISIGLEVKDQYLCLTVKDQGEGIPPAELSRIFDRFYRVGDRTQRQIDGAGLGLSLAKYIAEMHGGDVTITSAPSIGTTVRLTLPLEDKGRLLHQSMVLNSDFAERFRAAIGFLATPHPAGQAT
jgi:signal transduction histidine kinase